MEFLMSHVFFLHPLSHTLPALLTRNFAKFSACRTVLQIVERLVDVHIMTVPAQHSVAWLVCKVVEARLENKRRHCEIQNSGQRM